MSGTIGLPPGLVMRDLFLSGFHARWKIMFMVACVMLASGAIALRVKPTFQAKSTLLVLLGTEHTFRPAAGQQFMNSGGVDAEQVLRTEASILASDDLHRSVIREIEVKRLYPQLLEPPSEFSRLLTEAKVLIGQYTGVQDLVQPSTSANDPLSRALDRFRSDLTITVDRKSSVIALEFINQDPVVAADALRTLETQYFNLRAKLYVDVQVPIVQLQRDAVAQQLTEADVTLARFKQQHDISSFNERRAIMLRQQGDLEAALAKDQSTISGLEARLVQLNAQLGGGKKAPGNVAAPLQAMVQAYKQRQEEAQTTYRGSPAVDDARRQALERETDIAKMQATQGFTLQMDRNKTEADLKANTAGRETVQRQLTDLNTQLDALNAEETELHRLERARGIQEDAYRAVSKILDERQVVETVESNRQSSVRVIQPPRPPVLPRPIRQLILLAGVIISVLIAVTVTLFAHFFRSIYLRPEALEMDTGLAVLTSVPDTKALSRATLLVLPG